MKTNALLVAAYLAFVGISLFYWFRLGEELDNSTWAFETTRKIAESGAESGVSPEKGKFYATRTVQMLNAFESVKAYQNREARIYVLLALTLTLPLATCLIGGLKKRKPA